MDGHKRVAWQQRIPPTVQQKSWWGRFSQCARCRNMQETAFAMACHAHFHSGNTTVWDVKARHLLQYGALPL